MFTDTRIFCPCIHIRLYAGNICLNTGLPQFVFKKIRVYTSHCILINCGIPYADTRMFCPCIHIRLYAGNICPITEFLSVRIQINTGRYVPLYSNKLWRTVYRYENVLSLYTYTKRCGKHLSHYGVFINPYTLTYFSVFPRIHEKIREYVGEYDVVFRCIFRSVVVCYF